MVQKLSTTRWSARVDAAAALAKGYDSILEALCEISNDADQTANARSDISECVHNVSHLPLHDDYQL